MRLQKNPAKIWNYGTMCVRVFRSREIDRESHLNAQKNPSKTRNYEALVFVCVCVCVLRKRESEPSQCTKLAKSKKPWARLQRKRPSLGVAKAIVLLQSQGEGIKSAWARC